MSHEVFSLDELARHLGRDRREIEKLVTRGRIPGRKVGSTWQFHSSEVTRWLEHEMREYSSAELRNVEITQQSKEICPNLPVSSLLHPETVVVPLEARTKRSVLESLVEAAGCTWQVWSPSEILSAVQQREELLSTAYPGGIAIPHPRNPLPDAHGESIIAFGRTMTGIPFGAPHGGLTDLFFFVLCQDSKSHLQVLARLGRMLQLPEFMAQLRETQDSKSAYDIICETERQIAAVDDQ
ncbi:MAG: PTS sugar transporter subunit IIA [Planctomycetota bacterium]|nr:PTS sugar transporter subunit IIA [Planctomycetota bacterium]MDA1162445.1 PTS sugar transporter subunit IIA [Planctomycetota bacterium]